MARLVAAARGSQAGGCSLVRRAGSRRCGRGQRFDRPRALRIHVSATFAQRCGVHDAAREQATERAIRVVDAAGVELVRIVWCDLHGITRGKTIVASALRQLLADGIGMVSTLMLKDT